MEVERKYLVNNLPDNLGRYPHVEIEQGYLCTSPTLRIRRMGDECILTVKERVVTASTAIHNREEEFKLSRESYDSLVPKCDGIFVRKTRYFIPMTTGFTAELDIFHGVHDGLRMVEVEFPGSVAADGFGPPSWFGPEVSSDHRYRNSWLAFNKLT